MRAGGKPIWTYTAQDNIRILNPLAFYRGQAWFAFHWGLQGGGYWVYHSDDLWATKLENDPSYGSVAFDGRNIVTSRRWEATRDGIEDFHMLHLVNNLLATRPDQNMNKVLKEAVEYIGPAAAPHMPREAIEKSVEYHKLTAYRTEMRDFLEKPFLNH
jgi:hypothetical protein